ncbi:hypothetical protein GCM10010174_23650 [Kutzneria viridogrisea]|uniref:Intracellular septation protein A n=1 Tax=Kutzneria viridogrisea TaxID=47990 RepID=A0ABR6BWJ3_9PSEU|nr:hypothetical protein [Kutzneria viridogrisea]
MTTTKLPVSDQTEERRAALRGLLPLVVDILLPLGAYYLLSNLGVPTIWALALSGLIPAGRTIWSFLRNGAPDRLALVVLVFTVVGIPISLLTGSPQFMLAKESVGILPLGLLVIGAGLRGKPMMAAAVKPFLAGSSAKAAAWEHLLATSPEFRGHLVTASTVWGMGMVLEFFARLAVIYLLPFDTAVWATNIPLIAMIVLCNVAQRPAVARAAAMLGQHTA